MVDSPQSAIIYSESQLTDNLGRRIIAKTIVVENGVPTAFGQTAYFGMAYATAPDRPPHGFFYELSGALSPSEAFEQLEPQKARGLADEMARLKKQSLGKI